MGDNIQINTTGRLTPCLQQKIDKTRYLVEVYFSATSTQNVKDKLKRVILHDLEHVEPPYAERHVRWCERGEKISPTRLPKTHNHSSKRRKTIWHFSQAQSTL